MSFDHFICTFDCNNRSPNFGHFCIETAMFSGTLTKRSALNSQEFDTESNVLA